MFFVDSACSKCQQKALHKTDKSDQYNAYHLGLSCLPPPGCYRHRQKTVRFWFDIKRVHFTRNKMFSRDLILPKWITLPFLHHFDYWDYVQPSRSLRCCILSCWQTAEIASEHLLSYWLRHKCEIQEAGDSAVVHVRIRTSGSWTSKSESQVFDRNIVINEPQTPMSSALPISEGICMIKPMCLQCVTY